MDKKSVAFALPMGLTLGGSNIWSLQMAEALRDSGHAPALLQHPPIAKGRLFALEAPAGVRCIPCPWVYGSRLGRDALRSLAQSYAEVLPAVFIPNITTAAYAACAQLAVRHAEGMRIIGIAHGQGELHLQWLKYYEPVIHRFIAVSDEVAELLQESIPHRTGDIFTKACAVDIPPDSNRSYSAAGQPLQIVYAGRITNHEKRVHLLIPLAEALVKRGVDFRLRIIGDGGFRWGLNKAVRELPPEVQKHIAVEGPCPPKEMAAVWAVADVCVLVSDREGTAVSMLEAMAHGCVPVVTRVSGTAAVVEHGVNGFVSDIDDLEAMTDHIVKLADDRSLLATCGRRGHEKIAAGYALADYRSWFLDLIQAAWDDKPRAWDASRPVVMSGRPSPRPGVWSALGRVFARREAPA
ncbi:MAG TPA: glycosyltransferase family 4 protein [Kiritimatiellia bacterium]|nr:glycosyltransferase family 4 protein [Kiritimatiellia bacterium]HNS81802.1 glycosyltransferase family 4 protein [Kiritimatiellia bacterium]